MTRSLAALIGNRRGSAAVEMALVLPILLFLMCGAVEAGNYFLSEHVVDKAVRDAARYAARLPFADYSGCAVPSPGDAETQTQRVARFGDPDGTGNARLVGWTADSMTTVTISCDTSTGHSYVNNGIYADFPNGGEVPVITVTATVPYNTFFGWLGLGSASLSLYATSQAAVIGA